MKKIDHENDDKLFLKNSTDRRIHWTNCYPKRGQRYKKVGWAFEWRNNGIRRPNN